MEKRKPFIVIQTDFGKGIAVATMEGVIHDVDPDLTTFELNHDVTPFDTYEASFCLYYTVPFWPAGTIFISVVDPGVGTDRRASVAKLSNGSYVVTPDNGTLTHLAKYIGIDEVRTIDEERNRLVQTKACSIFHGRDLFAYCAAKFASGKITYEEVGPAYDPAEIIVHEMIEPKVVDGTVTGMLESADRHFGLICSNIPHEMIGEIGVRYGDWVRCVVKHGEDTVFDQAIRYEKSFGYVERNEIFAMISETLTLQIARNFNNICDAYTFGSGPEWTISFTKKGE